MPIYRSGRWTIAPKVCKIRKQETSIIELTDQQVQALENSGVGPINLVNPQTGEAFVLLRLDDFNCLRDEEYDDSPWTREELNALAWEAGKHSGWDDMDEPS